MSFVGKREEGDWTGAVGARRHEEADGMVFFLESGRAGGALKRGANAPQLFCCMQKKYISRSGLLQFFKIILDGISFYSVFFYSYFVMKSILLPLRMIRSDLSFDETGLLRKAR